MPPRLLRSLVALALVAGVVAGATFSYAQTDPDPKSAGELREAIGEASAEEAAAIAEVREVQARRAELEAAAAALDRKITDASAREAAAQAEVDRVQAEVDAVQREIDRIQADIDASKEEFEDSAATLYRNAGAGATSLDVLKFANDPADGISAQRYLSDISRRAQREIDQFGVLQDDLDDAQDQLEDQRDAADQARAAVAVERAEVERLRAEAEPARAAAEAEEAREGQMLAGISARKDEFEGQLAALQAEQAALGRGVSRGSGNGRLSWPCDGDVSSGFGYRVHPISGASRMHTGLDLGCANGAPIHAAGSGTVNAAGVRGGYGNAVVIDHGDGLATLYGHQSRLAVSAGQQVSEGDVIGYVGSTGYSTGPHLHWEVWVNGTPVDPMGYS